MCFGTGAAPTRIVHKKLKSLPKLGNIYVFLNSFHGPSRFFHIKEARPWTPCLATKDSRFPLAITMQSIYTGSNFFRESTFSMPTTLSPVRQSPIAPHIKGICQP